MAVELSDVVFKMSDCYNRQYFFTLNNNLQNNGKHKINSVLR